MTLEEIFRHWEDDSKINESALDRESLKIPQLHSKYFKIFSAERLRLKEMQGKHKQLLLNKSEFLTQGPTEEQHKMGWQLPARGALGKGMILKTEVEKYLDADQMIIDSNLKIAYQQEKVSLLESIIDNLNRRSFVIKNAIEFIRWTQGG